MRLIDRMDDPSITAEVVTFLFASLEDSGLRVLKVFTPLSPLLGHYCSATLHLYQNASPESFFSPSLEFFQTAGSSMLSTEAPAFQKGTREAEGAPSKQ